MNSVHMIAYTDGANMPKADFKHAGSAVAARLELSIGAVYMYEWGKYLGDQTNNIAELCAIELAVILHSRIAPRVPLTVVTDSQYCQGVLTFDAARERWKYKAKKNTAVIERIRKALPPLDMFEILWVKGHAGDRFNERADQLARFCKENRRDWKASYWENSGFPPLA